MVPYEGQRDVLDLGKLKVHEATGVIGRVVDEVSPRDPRFSHYRVLIELPNGTRQDFLFLELRDATAAEIARYEASHGSAQKSG